ncbi:MAG: stage II sporulation protein M [Clostridia bacterium]|nr:stage II sporulation protein M [Clostridia bacterium]
MTIKAFNFKKIKGLKKESDREVKGLIITVSLFAAAMIIGAGTFKNTTAEISDFTTFFNNYISTRSEQKLYTVFFNSLFFNSIILTVINFAGLSCAGVPVIVFIILLKGLGAGVFSGLLFSQFSINGIGYYLITILPVSVISNSALLMACNDSIFLSADILSVSLAKKQADATIIMNHLKKNIVLLGLCILASALDCILTKAFEFMFTF